MIEHYDSVDVFVGVDVGKGEHHPPPPLRQLARTG